MKKVLIITYYWPPAGGAGVQRALKFVKYLPQFGWEPIVLTVENPDSPVDDPSLLKDIPEGTKVYKTKSLEPFELYKKFTGKKSDSKIPNDVLISKDNASFKDKIANWIRLNVFIPDAKIGWKRYAVKKGLEIIKKENIDLIFTTSPPQTVSLIGKALSKLSGVKWVADFRDPWMEIVYYQNLKRNWLTIKIDSSLEKKVLNSSNSIITTNQDVVNLFKSKVGGGKYFVIPNGYDESDFKENLYTKTDKFTIAYTGSMSVDRIPRPLIPALRKFIDKYKIDNIRLNFAGRFCNEFVELLREYNLLEYCELKNFIPHQESTKILQTSDVLLLVVDNVPNNNIFIPGKMYEYMGAKRPIYAIGPVNGEAHEFIKTTNSGEMTNYEDETKAFELLKKMYDNWSNDFFAYTFEVEKFSRKGMAKKLAEAFVKT